MCFDGMRNRYGIPLTFSFYTPDAEDTHTHTHTHTRGGASTHTRNDGT
jgi:hypothetical protein